MLVPQPQYDFLWQIKRLAMVDKWSLHSVQGTDPLFAFYEEKVNLGIFGITSLA